MIRLQNQKLLMEIDEHSGSLLRLRALQTGWDIVQPGMYNQAFELLLPLEDAFDVESEFRSRRNNRARSKDCPPARCTHDDMSATFYWDQVKSRYGGLHDISVCMKIELSEHAARFTLDIDNRSDVVVENAYYPILSPLCFPQDTESFECFVRGYSAPDRISMYPEFRNMRGYYGLEHPTLIVGSNPQTPYAFLRNERQGLAVMVGDRSAEPLFYVSQLYPGWGESISSHWPQSAGQPCARVGEKDVYCDFAPGHLPYVAPGERRALAPIVLEPFVGGWEAGADIYKRMLDSLYKKSTNPAWLDEPHSWLQYHMNSPEDELRMRFTELPKLAAQCAAAGIRAIQLVGWNDGGQDQGNPSHDPDPRLGTFEELRQAIADCEALGVKLVLFSKFNWVDVGSAVQRARLADCAVRDAFGDPCQHGGYRYLTLSQISDVRVKRFWALCFNHDKTIDICKEEFDKLIALGAPGTLYDECFHRAPTWLCFDKNHTHRTPAPTQGMDIAFANIMRTGAPEDFLMAGEALYNAMFESYHLSYFRSESVDHIPLDRYVSNDCRIMTAVTGFSDRNMLNQCLLYNYIVSYEPYYFKGAPSDFPETIAYGRLMQELRAQLREYLWDGEFMSTRGAAVQSDEPLLRYSVFRSRKSGVPLVVVANYNEQDTATAHIQIADAAPTRYRLVDGEWCAFTGTVELPPRSAAVIY